MIGTHDPRPPIHHDQETAEQPKNARHEPVHEEHRRDEQVVLHHDDPHTERETAHHAECRYPADAHQGEHAERRADEDEGEDDQRERKVRDPWSRDGVDKRGPC